MTSVFERLDVETEQQDMHAYTPLPLCRAVVVLALVTVCMLGVGGALCIISPSCTQSIPTIQNLLGDPMTSPFVVTSANTAHLLHFLVAVGLYRMARPVTRRWAQMQMGAAVAFYICIAVTMCTIPFIPWNRNVSNVALTVSIGVWMVCATACFGKIYNRRRYSLERKRIWWAIGSTGVYWVSSAVYAVFRLLPEDTITEVTRDIGLLCVEVACGVSVALFMVWCVVGLRGIALTMTLDK